MTLGATLTSVVVPDRDGQRANVTLNLETVLQPGEVCYPETIHRFGVHDVCTGGGSN